MKKVKITPTWTSITPFLLKVLRENTRPSVIGPTVMELWKLDPERMPALLDAVVSKSPAKWGKAADEIMELAREMDAALKRDKS